MRVRGGTARHTIRFRRRFCESRSAPPLARSPRRWRHATGAELASAAIASSSAPRYRFEPRSPFVCLAVRPELDELAHSCHRRYQVSPSRCWHRRCCGSLGGRLGGRGRWPARRCGALPRCPDSGGASSARGCGNGRRDRSVPGPSRAASRRDVAGRGRTTGAGASPPAPRSVPGVSACALDPPCCAAEHVVDSQPAGCRSGASVHGGVRMRRPRPERHGPCRRPDSVGWPSAARLRVPPGVRPGHREARALRPPPAHSGKLPPRERPGWRPAARAEAVACRVLAL